MRRLLLAALLGALLSPIGPTRSGLAQDAGVLRLVAPTEIGGLAPGKAGRSSSAWG